MEDAIQTLWSVYDFLAKHKKLLLASVATVLVVAVAFVSNQHFMAKRNQAAHEKFLALQEVFDAQVGPNLEFKTAEQKHEAIASFARDALKNHYKSSLAPFFLASQAEALRQLGKQDEALEAMEQAAGYMSAVEVKPLFQVKLQVMRMESGKQELVEQGLEALKAMVGNDLSMAARMATYHLHEYYFVHRDYAQAKMYGDQLLFKFANAVKQNSDFAFFDGSNEYVDQVKQNLSLIAPEV